MSDYRFDELTIDEAVNITTAFLSQAVTNLVAYNLLEVIVRISNNRDTKNLIENFESIDSGELTIKQLEYYTKVFQDFYDAFVEYYKLTQDTVHENKWFSDLIPTHEPEENDIEIVKLDQTWDFIKGL